MQIHICHGALNKGLFDLHLCLAYFDIYAIQKCQHCQLCILRENSIALAMCGDLQLPSLSTLSVL